MKIFSTKLQFTKKLTFAKKNDISGIINVISETTNTCTLKRELEMSPLAS